MIDPPHAGGPLLCGLLLIASVAGVVAATADWEIDETGAVNHIVDGDTFDAVPMGRVRLADIDTAEVGEPGARQATDYLASLIFNRLVYLDVDDRNGRDTYDRLVAVVYVRHNNTHLLNVNMAMLQAGLAEIVDYPNEFEPSIWTAYVYYATEVSPTVKSLAADWAVDVSVMIIVIVSVAAVVLLHLIAKRRPRG